MKIMWMSNAPWANTGYGSQTRVWVPRLREAGHQMSIFAFYGLEGGILNWDGVKVYPKRVDQWGNDVAASHKLHSAIDEHTKAEELQGANIGILLSLIDAWVLNPDALQTMGVKWVPWYPVDHEPLPPPIVAKVKKAFARIVYSRFGQRMTEDAGLSCHYVPHGIDTKVFKPMDRQAAREKMGIPNDRFVVGMVAANKGVPSRKAFPQSIRAFAEFGRKHDDALLYLHAAKGNQGESQAVNLPELIELEGIADKVGFTDQYQMFIGLPDEWMANLYNCFDVLLSPSMGEGFGLPIVEAQACGTPVIVGDWTSMSELCFGGWKIPHKRTHVQDWYTPLAAYQFSPEWEAIHELLEEAYGRTDSRREMAVKGAKQYDADRVAKKFWKPALDAIQAELDLWQA